MGFFDSFKTGLGNFTSGLGDFIGDMTGMALGAAPTIIPLLQSTGVIPQVQPSGIATGPGGGYTNYGPRGYTGYTLPGGAPAPVYRPNPFPGPVGFPTGQPTNQPTAPYGVKPMAAFQSTRGGFQH
ncbi:unnamed protein product, partial [marine sediment metagenome]